MRFLLESEMEVTLWWVGSQVIPAHLHGVESESDQERRACVGSPAMAALRAKSERPSEFTEEVREMQKVKKQRKLSTTSVLGCFIFRFYQ